MERQIPYAARDTIIIYALIKAILSKQWSGVALFYHNLYLYIYTVKLFPLRFDGEMVKSFLL